MAAVAKRSVRSLPRSRPVDLYRVFNVVGQIAIILTVVFGGLGVWNALSSKVDVLAALQNRQSDDIKEVKTSLQIITDKLTSVEIGLAGKADRK